MSTPAGLMALGALLHVRVAADGELPCRSFVFASLVHSIRAAEHVRLPVEAPAVSVARQRAVRWLAGEVTVYVEHFRPLGRPLRRSRALGGHPGRGPGRTHSLALVVTRRGDHVALWVDGRVVPVHTLVVEVVDCATVPVRVVGDQVAPAASSEGPHLTLDERVARDQPVAHLVVKIDGLVRGDLHPEPRRVLDAEECVVSEYVAAVHERVAALPTCVEATAVGRLERAVRHRISLEYGLDATKLVSEVPTAQHAVMRGDRDIVVSESIVDAAPEDSWLVGPFPPRVTAHIVALDQHPAFIERRRHTCGRANARATNFVYRVASDHSVGGVRHDDAVGTVLMHCHVLDHDTLSPRDLNPGVASLAHIEVRERGVLHRSSDIDDGTWLVAEHDDVVGRIQRSRWVEVERLSEFVDVVLARCVQLAK
mmetsp:Transcript_12198/g.28462  ORF Transcript_12198/g.28462 Transcript_12198/m.28462 type:complete len:425 (-) Transcript_12198:888-2162(-)